MSGWTGSEDRGICRACDTPSDDIDGSGLCPQCRAEIAELLQPDEDDYPRTGAEYIDAVIAAEAQGWR